ncbi:NADH-cytochrome b5 reductase-like [Asterias rubens]|uniref:NADH-cytochrome b5 reductase-like n=1 Tax=Asterias rubens TaxID=7604 RepID=UPI001455438C|nr:NADH-cytochrome b5 reductase-like [Asterias rubens]
MSSDSELAIECETCNAKKPTEPLASDCCGTGCNPCVFDLYEKELGSWREACERCHDGVGLGTSEHHEPARNIQNLSVDDALSPNEYRSLKLGNITRVSHDSAVYSFNLLGNSRLNLGVGQHMILRGSVNSKMITRQYTPISPSGSRGHFVVLIKVYENGAMSQYIKQWTEGDEVSWRGPFGSFSYQPNKNRRIVMLAAGTGIAPMLQVIRHIVTNDDDETFVRLLFANRTYEDILLRETLNELTAYWNFTVLYALSQGQSGQHPQGYGENFHYGRIDQDMIAEELKTTPEQDTLLLICGTKSFDKDMIKFLNKLDFKGQYFKF